MPIFSTEASHVTINPEVAVGGANVYTGVSESSPFKLTHSSSGIFMWMATTTWEIQSFNG